MYLILVIYFIDLFDVIYLIQLNWYKRTVYNVNDNTYAIKLYAR